MGYSLWGSKKSDTTERLSTTHQYWFTNQTWEIDGETEETVSDFIFLGSKITADGTAAMKLKDTYSFEEKL